MALQQEGKYIIKECIGKGSYGDVFLGCEGGRDGFVHCSR